MASETPDREEQQSFADLTVELIERAAHLAGERVSEPIRAAAGTAVRLLFYSACAAGVLALGLVFVGVAIGLLIGQAPEGSRWWICLLAGVALVLMAAAIAAAVFRRTRTKVGGASDRPT